MSLKTEAYRDKILRWTRKSIVSVTITMLPSSYHRSLCLALRSMGSVLAPSKTELIRRLLRETGVEKGAKKLDACRSNGAENSVDEKVLRRD